MFHTATRIANHKKKPRAKALRYEKIAEVSRYRHAQALRFRRPFMLGERFHLASQTSVF